MTLADFIECHQSGWYLHGMLGKYVAAADMLRWTPVEHARRALRIVDEGDGVHFGLAFHGDEDPGAYYYWEDRPPRWEPLGRMRMPDTLLPPEQSPHLDQMEALRALVDRVVYRKGVEQG